MCRQSRCLSFILTCSCLQVRAAYPPAKDGPSFDAGIFGFATHEMCVILCHHKTRWALTPPFHPCSLDGSGCFLSHCPRCHHRLSVRKHDALCCPDFPLRMRSDRPRFCIISCFLGNPQFKISFVRFPQLYPLFHHIQAMKCRDLNGS